MKMRNNALYFPYIEVPDEIWTSRILLYWDRLSSIVPMDYIDNPTFLSPYMLDLVREGLVEQIIPASHLYRFRGFEENFIRYLESRRPKVRKPSGAPERTRIHIEKLGDLLLWLEENELAEIDQYPWCKVDKWVARAFMAYLAASLGSLEEVNAAPVTNDFGTSRLFGALSRQRTIEREFLLGKLLPAPARRPSLASIIEFKGKYGHLLPPFRQRIELLSGELGAIRDTRQRLARAEVIVRELTDQVREIEEAMKVNWKDVIFGSFLPLLGAGGSFYAAGEPMIAAGAAGLTFSGVAYKTINDSRNRERQTNNDPLAYLAYARTLA